MNEIQVGEYIRTTNEGAIGLVENIKEAEDGIWYYTNNGYCKTERYITKHSKNIIDLIEVRRLCKWWTSSKTCT